MERNFPHPAPSLNRSRPGSNFAPFSPCWLKEGPSFAQLASNFGSTPLSAAKRSLAAKSRRTGGVRRLCGPTEGGGGGTFWRIRRLLGGTGRRMLWDRRRGRDRRSDG